MPTYDYICTSCSNEFEEFQKMSDPLIETCPKCSGKVIRKIGGGAGLLFKGSGFYQTDYKKTNGKPIKEEQKKEEPKKESEKKSSKSEDIK